MYEPEYDRIAAMDQACEDAKHTARPIAAFYLTLVEADVDELTLRELSQLYARRLLFGKARTS